VFPPESADYTALVGWYSSAPQNLSRTNAGIPPLLALLGLGCAARLVPPPALFPMKSVWQTSVEEAIEGPLVTDGRFVFVSTASGAVFALGLGNGHVAWKAATGAVARIAAAPGVLLARHEDGLVTSLDPATGTVRWKAATGVPGSLPPLLEANAVFVAGDGVAAIEVATGRLLWIATDGAQVTAPAAAAGGRLFLGETDGTLRCRDRVSGASLWTFPTGSALRAAAASDERQSVLVGTTARGFLALSSDRGKRRWRWKLGADVLMPPLVFEGSILVASHDAVLYALNRANGHLDWRAPLPARPLSGPLPFGTTVLVACLDDEVVGFDARTGRSLGRLKTSAEIRGAPLLVEDRLYVGQRDRSVASYLLDSTPAKVPAPAQSRTKERPGRVP